MLVERLRAALAEQGANKWGAKPVFHLVEGVAELSLLKGPRADE
jgi:hypothetical protein